MYLGRVEADAVGWQRARYKEQASSQELRKGCLVLQASLVWRPQSRLSQRMSMRVQGQVPAVPLGNDSCSAAPDLCIAGGDNQQ